MLTANAQQQTAIWLRGLNKELKSEPTIKDVCDTCNNVTLGRLDDYVCNLFDTQFIDIPQRGNSVTFRYEYHSLKRWLLKISFNSARLHESFFAEHTSVIEPLSLGAYS